MNECSMAVVRAWLNPGPRPDIHLAAQQALIRNWPTLADAVQALCLEWLCEDPETARLVQEITGVKDDECTCTSHLEEDTNTMVITPDPNCAWSGHYEPQRFFAELDSQHFDRPPGPHTYEVCDQCNYNTHMCHFCGDDLTHTEATMKHNPPHPCYSPEALAEMGMTGVGENPETALP